MNEDRLIEIENIINGRSNKYDVCHNDILELVNTLRSERQKAADLQLELDELTTLRPIEELQTENDVLLWYVPVQEPPIVGSCNDEHFDSYYQTHWSPLPRIKDI